MAEVLVEYTDVVLAADDRRFTARACGTETEAQRWEGWLEFEDVSTGEVIQTGRETTQPNRTDALYWATGLTAVYLEGALDRALRPLVGRAPASLPEPAFDAPAPPLRPYEDAPPASSILDPFSVYRKGEALLRRQLSALAAWHLVNIIRAHDLSDLSAAALEAMPPEALVELIVAEVRAQARRLAGR